MTIRTGSQVRFIAHGETGLIHTVAEMVGDDADLTDPRGRCLARVPIELLEPVTAVQPMSAIRAVDELQ